MNLEYFKNKWDDKIDENLKEEFLLDVTRLVDGLFPNRFQQVAIEVLSDIPGTELKMYDVAGEYPNSCISFGKVGQSEISGVVVNYSKAVGINGYDFFQLLKTAVESKIN